MKGIKKLFFTVVESGSSVFVLEGSKLNGWIVLLVCSLSLPESRLLDWL